MPEKEFEIYLSVLSKLLRLSPAQKAAISDELRDHMEERLETLMKTGVSREEAIKTAMDEFGDVTGLALDLTKVSRTPLRKIVIGSTLTASIAAAMIVGWVTLFAPQHRMVAPAPVEAQFTQKPTKPTENPAAPAVDVQKELEQPIIAADEELFPEFLTKRTDVDFVDLPLKDACKTLENMHDVPVFLQRQKLAEQDIAIETPVNLKLQGLTFEEVLNHMARNLGGGWYVDEGIIQITGQGEEPLLTRKYDLRRLTSRGHTIPSLLQAFQYSGGMWTQIDGDGGSMSVVGEAVVVRQSFQIQRRIVQLLGALERKERMFRLGTCTDRDQMVAALTEPCAVEFVDTPLLEAMEFVSTSHHIPVQLDRQALTDEGINFDSQITLTLKKRPLKKVLDLMLDELGLTYVIRDGVLRVTTKTTADEMMEWIVYNVDDFANSTELVTQFMSAIYQSTSGKWEHSDGDGGNIVRMAVGGYLVIKQTDRVHFEIQALMAQLRNSPLDRNDNTDKAAASFAMITKTYRMPKDIASDLLAAIPKLIAPTSWTSVDDEKPMIQLIASTPIMDHVDGLASGGNLEIHVINVPAEKPNKQSPPAVNQPPSDTGAQPQPAVAPEASAPASVRSIVARPSSVLLIRQTPEVHREIQMLLRSLHVRLEPGIGMGGGMGGAMNGSGMGGMGGGFIGGMGGGMGGMGGGGMGGGGFF